MIGLLIRIANLILPCFISSFFFIRASYPFYKIIIYYNYDKILGKENSNE